MRRLVAALRAVVGAGLLLATGLAAAHKSSDSYVQIDAAPAQLHVRWDIALRDLDVALDLDADGDGKLTWGEIKAAWPRIEAYALPRLQIAGCVLKDAGRGLERRNDGAYAVLELQADCSLPNPPVIVYSLFAEVDPTHRGLVKIQRPGEPVQLSMLEPTHLADATPAAGGSSAFAAGAGASASPATAATKDHAAASRWQFLGEGVRHILTGYDHVLFLICLLLPAVLRRQEGSWRPVERLGAALWPVVGIVSAFTVAHSITLCLAALKVVSLSPAFIEPAIAVTIMLAAIDNIRPIFPVRRVVVAFFFGLIHGFGFASVLAELNLAPADFAWALLQFNVGLEMGQLMIVISATALLFSLRRWRRYRAVVVVAGSTLALVIAGIWFVERVGNVSLMPF